MCLRVHFRFDLVIFTEIATSSFSWSWTMKIHGKDYCRTKTLRQSRVKMFVPLEQTLNPSVLPSPCQENENVNSNSLYGL